MKAIDDALNKIHEDIIMYTAPPEGYGAILHKKIEGRLRRMADSILSNDETETEAMKEVSATDGVQAPALLNEDDLRVGAMMDGTVMVGHVPTGLVAFGSGGTPEQRKEAAIRSLEGRVEAHYQYEEHLNWVCPRCQSKHSRGHIHGSPGTYRCLRCGYTEGENPIESIADIKTGKDAQKESCGPSLSGFHRPEPASFIRPGRLLEDRDPPMMTIPDLERELKRLDRWGDGGPVLGLDEKLPPGSYLIADLYTDNYVYRIRAVTRGSYEKSKLECVAQCRKLRPGEDWTRGNDLSNGRLDWNTWFSILRDIVGYEMVSGRPQ